MTRQWKGNGYYDTAFYEDDYTQEQGVSNDAGCEHSDEYWRVDADVRGMFMRLAPNAQGESVELGELPELCRLMGRPLRDDHEKFRLMQELDSTNSMVILRHDFVTWLLSERNAEERARSEAVSRSISVATPAWEEVVQEVSEADLLLGKKHTVFYYNILSGESIWELPSFVRCLWNYVETVETAQQEQQLSRDGVPAYLKSNKENSDDAAEMIQQLRELFVKYDHDKSGYLDPAEFEGLCVRVRKPLVGREELFALMQEVDPFGFSVQAFHSSERQMGVSWESLQHYWVTNAPFQRRTKLSGMEYSSWERIDSLARRATPVVFRHTTTQHERWGHPAMEQRVVDRLHHLFPSPKLEWPQKLDLFLDVQWQQQEQRGGSTKGADIRAWSLETCWRVFTQFGHLMSRRQHVQEVMKHLQQRLGVCTTTEDDKKHISVLDEAAVRVWLQYCAKKVDMDGWEEGVDSEGQAYYYHEVNGTVQWEPPTLQAQMTTMLCKHPNQSVDDQIAHLFRQYDADESGEMTWDEFKPFYRALLRRSKASDGASDAQLQQVFSVLDASGDGVITLEEFQFWWKTKLELEVKVTKEVESLTREKRRREICRQFLENADALVLVPTAQSWSENVASDHYAERTRECFASNLLPRLVRLLGEFPLQGLAYRRALHELVTDSMEQLVSLDHFVEWYNRFESAERDKVEHERAKQRAKAKLRAQHEAQTAAREKQRRHHKQMRTLNVMNEQVTVITEHEVQERRTKKITALFRTLDTDGSGLLDEKELLQLTKALGHEMDAMQVSRLVEVMDSSGDKRINLDEFLAFWNAFELRRPVRANAPTLHQTRRDAVFKPARETEAASSSPHLTAGDAVASLGGSLDMVKDRALKFTLADLRTALTHWTDGLTGKRSERQAAHDEAEKSKKRRQLRTFVPTKNRVYGAKRLDVTWIEPEVVDCVAAIIADVRWRIDPPLKADAAQRIQTLVRGHLARKKVSVLVCRRFQQHLDLPTRMFYFVHTLTGRVHLTRPLYPTSTSSIAPLRREDCASKVDRYHFDKRLAQLRAKKRLYDRICFPLSVALDGMSHLTLKDASSYRPMLAPSAFYMYDVTALVHRRLLGNIWTPLRSSPPESVLVELIARRRRRQLMQRGQDAAANLPLHYVVRHSQFTASVVRSLVDGYPQALAECDAFGMTPLHVAFREQRSSVKVLSLLARRPPHHLHFAESRWSSGDDSHKQTARIASSIWTRQTVCGDTPLHVAIRHRASIGVLQWALSTCAKAIKALMPTLFNDRGESAFHTCITQQQQRQTLAPYEASRFSSPRSKTLVLLFFKHFDTKALCSMATKHGDLPLHLAMDAFNEQSQSPMETSRTKRLEQNGKDDFGTDGGTHWLWLVELLLVHYPMAVLTPKQSNGLLPIQLAIKYGVPEELSMKMFELTVKMLQQTNQLTTEDDEQTLVAATTITETRTTLLHYALFYQPRSTNLLSLLIKRMSLSCQTICLSTGNLPIHVAAAAHGVSSKVLHNLCETYSEGCRTYNAKRHLPLHVTIIHDARNVDKATVLLRHCKEMILADTEERRALRVLCLAANKTVPDYRTLLLLLDIAPCRTLSATCSERKSRAQHVTPLYALSLRRCPPAITQYDVARRCHDTFEGIDDENMHFLAMAKAKLRKQHYIPTPKWTFTKILNLLERNPLDEALIQRALYAVNEKLRAMSIAEEQESAGKQGGKRKGNGVVVDTVTLNSDLMLVRTVQQILYEFPVNPRLQLLGQAIFRKLLPSAYVRAMYKAKIDPYCNL